MIKRLPVILLAGFISEIFIFYKLSVWIDASTVLLACLITLWIGFSIIRRQKGSAASEAARIFSDPSASKTAISAPIFRYISAFFLILPGFLTDFIGLLLLIPPIQRLLARKIPIQSVNFSTHGYSTGFRNVTKDASLTSEARARDAEIEDVAYEDLPQ